MVIIHSKAKNVFSTPCGEAPRRFLIFCGPRGVLSFRVFITSVLLLNLQNTSLASYTADPLPHHRCYRLACEDLLPLRWQGSMWRVGEVRRRGKTCCRIGPALSAGCLLGGRAGKQQPHNRPIHQAATRTPDSRSTPEVSFPPLRRAGQNLGFISGMVSSPRSTSDWHVLNFFPFFQDQKGEKEM